MKVKVRTFLQAAVIVATGLWVYGPAVRGDWLWDDPLEITKNAELRDPAGLGKIWFSPGGTDYFPLKSTVQWVQWRLWQDRAVGYHLTSIVLHLLSAFLLWWLLLKLLGEKAGTGSFPTAWVGGLLFALHPLAVESVAWISELKNTLSLPLLLLAMGAYIDYDRRPTPGKYLLALLLFIASCLCKTSGIMFPAVLLLLAWWRRDRIRQSDLLASAPFFLVSLALGGLTMWFQHHRAMPGGLAVPLGGLLAQTARAGVAVAFYFSKCAFPAGPLPNYPRWAITPLAPARFLPWLVLGAVFAWLWTRRETGKPQGVAWGRQVLFGLGFFILNLVPVLGFIPMAYLRIAWVADHLVYVPLLGLVGLAAAGLGMLRNRLPSVVLWSGTVLLAAALACQSHAYARIFTGDERFWTYAARHNPEAWMAQYNLGNQLRLRGRMDEAIARYERSLQIQPDTPEVENDLGAALAFAGRPSEAIVHFGRALRLRADFPDATKNLGTVLAQTGRLVEAAEQFEAAARLDPADAEAHYKLGLVLGALGRTAEAEVQMRQAARLQAGR